MSRTRTNAPMYAAIIEVLRERGAPGMTTAELAAATGLHPRRVHMALGCQRQHIDGVVEHDPDTGRPRKRWTYVERVEPSEASSSDDSPQDWMTVRTTLAGFDCDRLARFVTFAACLEAYVDATARGLRSKCNGCPVGRGHRIRYALA